MTDLGLGVVVSMKDAFGKIRNILELPISALVKAFGTLFDAVFSIFEIFGLAATSADASTYYSLGDALGTILGIVAQILAYILGYVVDALSFVIRVVSVVVRSFVWLGKIIVGVLIDGAKWIAKFILLVRLVIEAFKMVGKVIFSVWQILSGDMGILDGLKAIGGAVYDFLATPLSWIRDVADGVWSFIKGIFTKIGSFFEVAGSWLASFFGELPIVSTFLDLFDSIGSFFSGDSTFFEAGRNILISLGKGIWSAVTYPLRLLKKALDWLWDLLPFSDSEEKSSEQGLEKSGSSILSSIGQGILSVLSLPAQLVGKAMGTVVDAFSWAWDGLSSIAQSAWSVVSAPFEWIGNAASNVWSGITSAASSAWEGMKSFGSSALDAVVSPFKSIADLASSTWDSVANAAGSAWDGIKSAASSTWDWLKSPFEGIAESESSAWDYLFGSESSSVAAPTITQGTMALAEPEFQSQQPSVGQVTIPVAYDNVGPFVPTALGHSTVGKSDFGEDQPFAPPADNVALPAYRAQLLSETRGAQAGGVSISSLGPGNVDQAAKGITSFLSKNRS